MSLLERINSDLVISLKAGDSFKSGVLRLIKASLKNREIEKRGVNKNSEATTRQTSPSLSDDDIIEVLNKEYKKRKEAIEMFIKGGRQDLVDRESREIGIIDIYRPKQISNEEVEATITNFLAGKQYSINDFGRLMKDLNQQLGGRADGSLVARILKEKINNGSKCLE